MTTQETPELPAEHPEEAEAHFAKQACGCTASADSRTAGEPCSAANWQGYPLRILIDILDP